MRQIDDARGLAAMKQWSEGEAARPVVALATRWSLGKLEKLLPGHAVEVRVPPFGAVQILGGTTHRRGTPPAVVEMNAHTWLELVTGSVQWGDAYENGDITASGQRTDLSEHFPLIGF